MRRGGLRSNIPKKSRNLLNISRPRVRFTGMADVNKLVFSILRFLKDQTTTGHLGDDAVESIEVAFQCLENAYGIELQNPEHVTKYQVQRNLLDIFNSQIHHEADSDFAGMSLHEPTPEEKIEAERLKNKGNDFMKAEKFSDALECYTQAIRLDCKNAVYFCNRAAAYSKLDKHQNAIEDCNRALTIDQNYSKAYGRLGIAYTALSDHESARECYRKALELDPDNQSYQNNLEIAEQKLRESAALGGFAAGPGGGLGALSGLDLGSLMQSPALMNMATTLMGNPQMQQMMTGMLSGAASQANNGGEQQGQGTTGPNSGQPGLNSLLQAGQQLAAQMQAQNPDLVAHLRSQMQNQQNPPQDPNKNQ